MKKALSLFLVFVMVALMIPFSAFMTSAAGETAQLSGDNRGYTTNGSSYWAWDFTKYSDDGTDGTIAESLPAGWTAPADTDLADTVDENGKPTNWITKIDTDGVQIGGPAQKIYIDDVSKIAGFDVLGSTQSYTITVNWMTTYKFAYMTFYMGAGGANPGWRFCFNGGPDGPYAIGNSDKLAGFWRRHNNDTNQTPSPTNDAGTVLNQADIRSLWNLAGASGADFTTSLEIVGGKLVAMHITGAGETVHYVPSTKDSVTGFGIGLQNWTNALVNVKSVAIEKGAYNGHVELPNAINVIHNYNVANAADIDAVPYDTYSVDGKGEVALKDGALWQTLKANEKVAYNSMIKIDEEYFAGLNSYTLDFTLAGGSLARIFFVSFGLNDDRNSYSSTDNETADIGYGFYDGHDFKLRFGNNGEDSDWGSDSHFSYVKDASTGKYVAANSAGATRLTDAMIAALKAGKSDINFRVVVENNYVSNAYVTIDGVTVIMTPKAMRPAPAGDVALVQQPASAQVNKSFGLKSVTIYDKAIYSQTVAATEQIVTPAGKAVVKNGSEATVVDAGYVAENAIALKDNTGAIVPAAPVVAGNVYAPITKADLQAKTVAAGDAELRLASNPGIRFKTSFAAGDFDFIMSLINAGAVKAVKMGTLVTVDTYLAEADAFTAEALAAYGASIEKNVYMDIVADATALYAENTFAGSVIGVKSLERNYVARAYVTLTLADGEITIYSDATEAVSVKELAQAIVEADYAGYDDDADAKAALDYLANYAA